MEVSLTLARVSCASAAEWSVYVLKMKEKLLRTEKIYNDSHQSSASSASSWRRLRALQQLWSQQPWIILSQQPWIPLHQDLDKFSQMSSIFARSLPSVWRVNKLSKQKVNWTESLWDRIIKRKTDIATETHMQERRLTCRQTDRWIGQEAAGIRNRDTQTWTLIKENDTYVHT